MFDEMMTHFGPCDIQRMNADGSGLTTVLSTDIEDCAGGPVWSPDGGIILLFQRLNLYTMAPDGSGFAQLTSFDRPGAYLDGWDWSPDGTRIVFARETPRGVGRLFVMNADGSEITQIAECDRRVCLGGERDAEPVWSPDGDLIAFARARNIYVVGPDGGRATRLTHCRATYRYRRCTKSGPVWSPDGTRIAFRAGAGRILVMDRDGSNIVRLPQERAYLRAWRPPVVA
jgi:Tol biopolymer transport system component